jgi:hypothetical protein
MRQKLKPLFLRGDTAVLGRRLDAEDQFSCIQGESPFLPAPERGDATHRGGGSFTTPLIFCSLSVIIKFTVATGLKQGVRSFYSSYSKKNAIFYQN